MKKNLTLIIPAYNEEATIKKVLDKVLSLEFVMQVIVVNDCSNDNTEQEILRISDSRLNYIKHERNQGKTAAIKTALSHVKGELALIQDADLEYDPDEIIFVCEPIWNDKADVVFGSRFLVRRASRVLYFYHFLANKFLTFFSNLFTNKNMTDIETGYKAFRSPLLVNMPIKSSGFGFEVEVIANISKTNARIFETPISYYGRTYEEGKKISLKDGIAAIWYIIYFNLKTSNSYSHFVNEFIDARN
ncbi:glycosyltransferase family 2 protein [bacterium]|nr:MAG: glycosyltransferase family 2 protein [bacterium]